MKKYIGIIMLILVAKFNLNYWVGLNPQYRKQIITSYALEFAQKARGKAKAIAIVSPEDWEVEIHVEMFEFGT